MPFLQCCVQLIKLGADVNIISKSSKTALIMAVLAGFEEIVKLLMKYAMFIFMNPFVYF